MAVVLLAAEQAAALLAAELALVDYQLYFVAVVAEEAVGAAGLAAAADF